MTRLKKFLKESWVYILIFITGFTLTIYPLISQMYYRIDSNNEIIEFTKKVSDLDKEDIRKRMDLARAYNSTLDASKLSDPFSEEEKKKGVAEYARMLQVGELIGHIEIPKIDEDLPIYAGTGDDILEKGSGHLEGTSLPVGGASTHTVLTAHRGLPDKKLFRNLDKLTYGDVFYVHNIETTLAYEVDQILVIEPTHFDDLLVKEGEDYATLLTCTPYMINSHRLIVRGHRIPYTPAVDDGTARTPGFYPNYLELLLITLPILLILIYAVLRQIRKSRTLRRKVGSLEENTNEDD